VVSHFAYGEGAPDACLIGAWVAPKAVLNSGEEKYSIFMLEAVGFCHIRESGELYSTTASKFA
jgi:hypothetical protein